MTVADYLKAKNLPQVRLAELIGVTEAAMSRYVAGRIPTPKILKKIVVATDGAVQPNDFYEAA